MPPRFTTELLVAQEVPAPHEITRAWLLQHDWILAKALLDESFRPALHYLANESAGAEIRLVELEKSLETQRQVIEDLREQVSALQTDLRSRYAAIQKAIQAVGEARAEEAGEGLGEKLCQFYVTGDDNSPQAARVREQAARDSRERAVREEREARDRLGSAMSAFEAASRDLADAKAAFENKELLVLRLRVHVKQNILHYMPAIWDHEHPDQRLFRLHDSPVPRILCLRAADKDL